MMPKKTKPPATPIAKGRTLTTAVKLTPAKPFEQLELPLPRHAARPNYLSRHELSRDVKKVLALLDGKEAA